MMILVGLTGIDWRRLQPRLLYATGPLMSLGNWALSPTANIIKHRRITTEQYINTQLLSIHQDDTKKIYIRLIWQLFSKLTIDNCYTRSQYGLTFIWINTDVPFKETAQFYELILHCRFHALIGMMKIHILPLWNIRTILNTEQPKTSTWITWLIELFILKR